VEVQKLDQMNIITSFIFIKVKSNRVVDSDVAGLCVLISLHLAQNLKNNEILGAALQTRHDMHVCILCPASPSSLYTQSYYMISNHKSDLKIINSRNYVPIASTTSSL
jgi:hypothetical protein